MKVVEELRLLQGQLTDLRAVLEEKRSQGSNAQVLADLITYLIE
jgi:hypothetical protein